MMKTALFLLSVFPWYFHFIESHFALGVSRNERIIQPISVEDSIALSKYMKENCESLQALDTTTPRGSFVRFTMAMDCTVAVIWGNQTFQRIFFPGWGADFYTGYFWQEARNNLLLLQGCGCPCWQGYALPLNDTDAVEFGYMQIAVDPKTDRILAWRNIYSARDSMLLIDLYKKKQQVLFLDSFAPYCIQQQGIKAVKFLKTGIYIRWERIHRPDENEDIPRYKEKFFRYEFNSSEH